MFSLEKVSAIQKKRPSSCSPRPLFWDVCGPHTGTRLRWYPDKVLSSRGKASPSPPFYIGSPLPFCYCSGPWLRSSRRWMNCNTLVSLWGSLPQFSPILLQSSSQYFQSSSLNIFLSPYQLQSSLSFKKKKQTTKSRLVGKA